jgi:hypothetical protein
LKISAAVQQLSVKYGHESCGVERELPFREDLSPEAEEQPLLEVVTRKLLEKVLQSGKDLASALVICKVWTLAMAL